MDNDATDAAATAADDDDGDDYLLSSCNMIHKSTILVVNRSGWRRNHLGRVIAYCIIQLTRATTAWQPAEINIIESAVGSRRQTASQSIMNKPNIFAQ